MRYLSSKYLSNEQAIPVQEEEKGRTALGFDWLRESGMRQRQRQGCRWTWPREEAGRLEQENDKVELHLSFKKKKVYCTRVIARTDS